MPKILVVEDDPTLRELLVYNLRQEGFTPLTAEDAPSAVHAVRREEPALVILDLMLPGGSGFDVCRQVRTFSTVPVIMLTARGEDIDRVLGLEIGADDYVTKPFSLRELLARVRAQLRRVAFERDENQEMDMIAGPLHMDVRTRTASIDGRPISLQPKEFDLLTFFMRNQGAVLRREQILQAVWGHEYVGPRTVDVHVRRIRSKLEDAADRAQIRTVHGVGYVFDGEGMPVPTPVIGTGGQR